MITKAIIGALVGYGIAATVLYVDERPEPFALAKPQFTGAALGVVVAVFLDRNPWQRIS